MQSRIILFSCPDQPGIIARLTSVLYETGVNILQLEQHVEERELFFMRICADVSRSDAQLTSQRLSELVRQLRGEIVLADPDEQERVGIFVTSEGGFLHDFYMQQKAGEVPFTIPLVISNREELQETAAVLDLPFRLVPMDEASRHKSEDVMIELLNEAKVGLVVLARYMKILSGRFVEHYPNRMINIHHGFLPAFKGARPYRQAWERGVKVIGATAHYVTA